MNITVKRAYEPAAVSDGFRIYVDRLWPRGLSHETFHYDLWDKGIAPSTDLREWFHADPEDRWDEFERRYLNELKENPGFAELCQQIKEHQRVTLLYSSHDALHNNAVVLQRALERLL
ncbi:MAG: DUF488 family protein [Prevotella sp.]|nr:DUF488 family protein [Bacteroides sp.]MCM1366508.1 DUF488 family protein [Prevotella sp.]MCM1436847.1 DUF488 family protein [Prevotella sp.]